MIVRAFWFFTTLTCYFLQMFDELRRPCFTVDYPALFEAVKDFQCFKIKQLFAGSLKQWYFQAWVNTQLHVKGQENEIKIQMWCVDS